MKLKDRLTVAEVYNTWIHGNISDAKLHINRMNKNEFLDFVEYFSTYNSDPFHKIRKLIK